MHVVIGALEVVAACVVIALVAVALVIFRPAARRRRRRRRHTKRPKIDLFAPARDDSPEASAESDA